MYKKFWYQLLLIIFIVFIFNIVIISKYINYYNTVNNYNKKYNDCDMQINSKEIFCINYKSYIGLLKNKKNERDKIIWELIKN